MGREREREGHEESVMAKPNHAISGGLSYRQNGTIFPHTLLFGFGQKISYISLKKQLINQFPFQALFFSVLNYLFDHSEITESTRHSKLQEEKIFHYKTNNV